MMGLFRRIFENFIACFVSSIPFTSLIILRFVKSVRFNAYLLMFTSAVLFLAVHIYFLRAYFTFARDKKLYYKVNYIAYGVFIIGSLGMLALCVNLDMKSLYTLLFLPLKFFNVFYPNALMSAIIYHAITLIIIFFVPFTINEDMISDMEEEEEIYEVDDMGLLSNEHFRD